MEERGLDVVRLTQLSKGTWGPEKKWPWQDLEYDLGSEQLGLRKLQTAPAAATPRWVSSTAHMVNWRHWLSRFLYACSGWCGWALLYWGLPSKRCCVKQTQADAAKVQIWLECVCYISLVAVSAEKMHRILLYKKVSKLLKLLLQKCSGLCLFRVYLSFIVSLICKPGVNDNLIMP